MRHMMVLAVMLAACKNGSDTGSDSPIDPDDVAALPAAFILTPGAIEYDGGSDCEENFSEDNCPEDDEEVEPPDWMTEVESEDAWTPFIVELMYGAEGRVWALLGESIATGTLSDTELVLSWVDFEESTEEDSFLDEYTYRVVSRSERERSVRLTKGEDGTWTGEATEMYRGNTTYRESDEFSSDAADYAGSSGQIPTYYLDENNGNDREEDDCEGDFCEIEIGGEEGANWPVTAEAVAAPGTLAAEVLPRWLSDSFD